MGMRMTQVLNEAGFSLLEVLAASAVLCAGIAALAQLFTIAIGSMAVAGDQTDAAILAGQKLEEIRAGRVHASGGDVVDAFGHSDEAGAVGADRTPYVRQWTVEPLPAFPDTASVVHVSVRRRQARGAGEIRVSTLLIGEAP